jgi:hypothetical protein
MEVPRRGRRWSFFGQAKSVRQKVSKRPNSRISTGGTPWRGDGMVEFTAKRTSCHVPPTAIPRHHSIRQFQAACVYVTLHVFTHLGTISALDPARTATATAGSFSVSVLCRSLAVALGQVSWCAKHGASTFMLHTVRATAGQDLEPPTSRPATWSCDPSSTNTISGWLPSAGMHQGSRMLLAAFRPKQGMLPYMALTLPCS